MSEKKLSARSQRRLRLEIAQRSVTEQALNVATKQVCTSESESCISGDSPASGSGSAAEGGEFGSGSLSDDSLSEHSETESERGGNDGLDSDLDMPSNDELDSSASIDSLSLSGESLSVGSTTSSDTDEEPPNVSASSPLFTGSEICSNEFITTFMSFVQRHNLTYACQTDLLKLLSIVLPTPSTVPTSSYTLTSYFVNYRKETIFQQFCGCCSDVIPPSSSCQSRICQSQGTTIHLCEDSTKLTDQGAL